MGKHDYDDFLSEIYDDAPYFGQPRSRSLKEFNKMYFEQVSRDDRILELGSGTGMLTVDMARAGYELDSVDISPSMHRVVGKKLAAETEATRSNVNQIVGDAIAYRGTQLYDVIVMAEGLIIALPDAKLQRALLENCHRNLRPGGRILTDFFQPRYKVIYNETLTEHARFRTKHGDTYLLSMSFENDQYTQVQTWNAVFRRMAADHGAEEVTTNTVHFRYVFKSEMELLLELTGFRVLEFDESFANGNGFRLIAEKV